MAVSLPVLGERGLAAGCGPDAVARYYAQTQDPAARELLLRLCEPLVRGVASDYNNPNLAEDLVQVGFLGLLRAIDMFDPARGTPFLVFARYFVRGEISHYVRDYGALVRRPRWLDRVNGQIEQAVGDYIGQHRRYPGLAALAESLGLAPEALTEILLTRQAVRTLSLDAEDDEGQPTVDLNQSGRRHGQVLEFSLDDRLAVVDALERLNLLQRSVIFYIFFTDLTQAETAARIGISQKHVSRVLATALLRLRQLLEPAPAAS